MSIEADDQRCGRAALCRAAAYRALSLGFSEPGAASVQALSEGDLPGAVREALDGLDGCEDCVAAARAVEERAAEAGSADAALQDLCAEYARLFTGPGAPAVACYESEYLEQPRANGRGRLGGAAAASVESAYLRDGVATTAGRREPPDFVAVEIEFLYALSIREAEAWAAGDAAKARRLHASSERFLSEHARRWLPAFARAARVESRHPFYVALGGLLGGFMAAQRSPGEEVGSADGPSGGASGEGA